MSGLAGVYSTCADGEDLSHSLCREELLRLSGPPGASARTAVERVLSYSGTRLDDREAVLTDLLTTLRRWVLMV